ncbi:hypothetical protein ACTFIR_012796 [Dictyostelium discoideum]
MAEREPPQTESLVLLREQALEKWTITSLYLTYLCAYFLSYEEMAKMLLQIISSQKDISDLSVEEIDKEAQAELNIENWDQLEAPLGFSEEIIDKIKPLIDAIHKKENNDEIVWYSQSNTLVFGVKSIQDLVFKMDIMGNDIESRTSKISQSEKTCSTQLPTYTKHCPIYYQNIQMIQQLALFIIETGFSHVEHRNIPIVAIGGFRKITSIDPSYLMQETETKHHCLYLR